MAEYPALMLWTDAYLADTGHLDHEEHGAYLLLLMTAWRSRECRLPDDDEYLAKAARCSARVWARLRKTVAAFWDIEDGYWTQKRLTRERKFLDARRAKLSAAAHAKHLKSKQTVDANAPSVHMQPTPTPTPTPEDKKDPATQAVAPPSAKSARAVLWAEAKEFYGGKNPGALIAGWCKQYGEGAWFEVYTAARRAENVDPVAWTIAALKARAKDKPSTDAKNRSPMASYHRTSALLEAEIQRRSELELEYYGNDPERKCAPQLN